MHELTLQLYKHVVTGEHVYGDWEVTTPSTCLTEGTETQTCQFCDATQTKSLPLGDHSWNEGVVTIKPTTAAEGVKTYTCTVCGETKTETIAALSAETPETPAAPGAPASAETGDTVQPVLLAAVMVLSLTGAAVLLKKKLLVK